MMYQADIYGDMIAILDHGWDKMAISMRSKGLATGAASTHPF